MCTPRADVAEWHLLAYSHAVGAHVKAIRDTATTQVRLAIAPIHLVQFASLLPEEAPLRLGWNGAAPGHGVLPRRFALSRPVNHADPPRPDAPHDSKQSDANTTLPAPEVTESHRRVGRCKRCRGTTAPPSSRRRASTHGLLFTVLSISAFSGGAGRGRLIRCCVQNAKNRCVPSTARGCISTSARGAAESFSTAASWSRSCPPSSGTTAGRRRTWSPAGTRAIPTRSVPAAGTRTRRARIVASTAGTTPTRPVPTGTTAAAAAASSGTCSAETG